MTLTVDDYVKTKILPEYQEAAQAIRNLMRVCAPHAKEEIAYGIPVWRAKKIFAVISPNKKGITFSFTHGAEFDDQYNLLKGVGKVSRHVKIKNFEAVGKNEAALRYYIQQALVFDAKDHQSPA